MEQKANINIDDGEAFFSNETSISHNPMQFVLDFKQITPRIDMRSQNMPQFKLKHNVVLLDPLHAKQVSEMLSKAVKEFEGKFGKIDVEKAMKKMQPPVKKGKQKEKIAEAPRAPSYFG